jgi:integrase
VYKILVELEESDRISTTSPMKIREGDVREFFGYCKERYDTATSVKYIRFLDEVLQYVGNSSVQAVKMKHKGLMPGPTQKEIVTISECDMARLLSGDYALEDEWWDIVGKAAVALYYHTGLRPSELRLEKLSDVDVRAGKLVVSSPKGRGKWATGKEEVPIMPGVEEILATYMEIRARRLRDLCKNPHEVEPLFPYLDTKGNVGYWHERVWNKLKPQIELASGVRFRWKDLRPSFAQKAKDNGAPIEAVSKCMRHGSTATTEKYYARIRSETAFSLVRQAWEAPVVKFQSALIEK